MAVSIPLTVTEPAGIVRRDEPVRSGIPLSRGAVGSPECLALVDEDGKTVPVQFETLSRWEDGSVRWVLLKFLQSIEARQTRHFRLETGSVPPAPPVEPVHVTQADDVFTVNTGRLKFDVPIYGGSILAGIERRDDAGRWCSVAREGLDALIWRGGANAFRSRAARCVVESAGPLEAVLKIEGHHRLWDARREAFDASGTATFAFVMRVFCNAGADAIRLQYTFINDHRDNRIRPSERYHRYALDELRDYEWINGQWVDRPAQMREREQDLLGDDFGQVPVRSIKLRLKLDDVHDRYRFGVCGGEPAAGAIDGPVALQQVGPVPHVDRVGDPLPFPHVPFRAMVLHGRGPSVHEFEKAEGWLTMQGAEAQTCCAGKHFWQYHPKVLACDPKRLEYHVWSSLEDIPDPEIGFAKTHEVGLRFAGAGAAIDPRSVMAALHGPLRAFATGQHYLATGTFGTFAGADHDLFGESEDRLRKSIERVEENEAQQHLYGVRDYGDTVRLRIDTPITSNQEYDPMLGSAVQFARTVDRAYLDRADVLAWHFMDVDVLHASNSPLNEQGQHMHFADHAKGETHAGHGTVEGLWFYHLLTGEPRAREVAEGIANFFAKVAAWKDFLDFRDDEERTIGWALKALVSSYHATRNPRYRLAAAMVVEQAIAGQDPDTGNWDHPLYPNEDPQRPTGIGGKPWMVGIILQGMKKYHLAFGDERVEKLILKAADWMIWSNYAYMTGAGWPPRAGGAGHLDGLSYAWELSGRRHYLDEALTIFAGVIARWAKQPPGQLQGVVAESVANMMRIIGQEGEAVWQNGRPVLDPESNRIVQDLRADPRFKPKPQHRF